MECGVRKFPRKVDPVPAVVDVAHAAVSRAAVVSRCGGRLTTLRSAFCVRFAPDTQRPYNARYSVRAVLRVLLGLLEVRSAHLQWPFVRRSNSTDFRLAMGATRLAGATRLRRDGLGCGGRDRVLAYDLESCGTAKTTCAT